MKIQYFLNLFTIYLLIKCNFLMAQDFSGTHFRNGDLIPYIESNEEWKKAGENKQPAWCYNNNDPANGIKYGKLYNWYAMTDPRGLCPLGWHVPSDTEWMQLLNYLGGDNFAGHKMKSSYGWEVNGNGSNSSGFTGLPGGLRHYDGDFQSGGHYGNWWSSPEAYKDDYYLYLCHDNGIAQRYRKDYPYGFSVRCLKD
jgi:uncharacterized protein (TIGR02145 family)